MQTNFIKSHPVNNMFSSAHTCKSSRNVKVTGLVSELVYSLEKLDIAQLLLLPLLQQLGTESRWQLWLTPQKKLSRSWLVESGLPPEKVMHVKASDTINTVETMIKAMQTGNYSVVLGWLPEKISSKDRCRLEAAALSGQTLGLIMRPHMQNFAQHRPLNGLKIQSGLYH